MQGVWIMGSVIIKSTNRHERIVDLLLQFQKGNHGDVISKVKEYRDIFHEDTLFLQCLLIKTLYKLDYPADAYRLLKKSIDNFPENGYLYYCAGEICELYGKTKAAEEFYLKVPEVTNNHVILSYTYTKMAGLRHNAWHEGEAADYIKMALKSYPGNKRAFDLLNEIVKSDQEMPETETDEENILIEDSDKEFNNKGQLYKIDTHIKGRDYAFDPISSYYYRKSYSESMYYGSGDENEEVLQICQGTRDSCKEVDIICYEADINELERDKKAKEALELLKEAEKKYPDFVYSRKEGKS